MACLYALEGPRSQTTSRRAVTTGLAWSVPAVAVASAAPSFAASTPPCTTYATYTAPFSTTYLKSDTGGLNATRLTGTAVSSTSGAPAVTYTVTRTTTGSVTMAAQNLLPADNGSYNNGAGDLKTDSIQLQQSGSSGSGAYQRVTFTFSQPIESLPFTIADIDNMTGGYKDAVSVSGATYTVVSRGSEVIGTGTVADPFRNSVGTAQTTSDLLKTRATILFTEPVTTFSIRYWSYGGTTMEQVFLTGMSFKALAC